jgi:hypothetical protein
VSELRVWITELAHTEPAVRQRAAEGLYAFGQALGEAALAPWRQQSELAVLVAGAPTVGVAVDPDRFAEIHRAWGRPPLAQVPPDQDAEEFELHMETAQLDILTTRTGQGAIARFLEKFGEGIQQVEYPVTDVDRATRLLSGLGIRAIYPEPRTGANQTRVNFFLATTPEGRKVLIELVELPRKTLR